MQSIWMQQPRPLDEPDHYVDTQDFWPGLPRNRMRQPRLSDEPDDYIDTHGFLARASSNFDALASSFRRAR
jgi:hypothetical protein